MLMKYILRLSCTIVTWSSATSAADLIYPNATESRSEKNEYWRNQKRFLQVVLYSWSIRNEGMYLILWLYFGEVQFKCTDEGLCNSKVCALWSRGKFAEILLKCRPHKQGCFEMILQGGECLHGKVMFF